jgi:hypothetical protein
MILKYIVLSQAKHHMHRVDGPAHGPSAQFPFFDRIEIESGCRFIVCALLIPWADYVSEVGEIKNEVTSAGWREPAEQFHQR